MIKGRWFLGWFGLYEHIKGFRNSGFVVSVRGTLVWGMILGALAWAAGAGAIYTIWQRNPYSVLTYGDALLYPLRRQEISVKQGQAFIAQGTDLWHRKRYLDAAALLRQGLARSPRELRARTLLGQFFLLTNRWPLALATLQEGIGTEYPGREYVQTMLAVAAQGEDFPTVVRLCQQLRSTLTPDQKAHDGRWLEARLFDALLAAGRGDEALALAEAEVPGDAATEHRVLALLTLKRADDAAAVLARQRTEPRANRELISRLEVRAFRETKRFDDMERTLAELRALAPANPSPLVYGVVQRALASRPDAAVRALDDYIFRFGGSAANLLLVARPLAEIGELSLVERCAAAAVERGYPRNPFESLRVSTALQRGEWAAAAQALARTTVGPGPNAAMETRQREFLRQLIEAALKPDEAVQRALVDTLRQSPWGLPTFRISVDVLRRAGRLATARDIATTATSMFPASAWAQTQVQEISRALEAQKPKPRDEPTVRGWTLPAGDAFFAGLESLIKDRQWPQAARLISDARSFEPPPLWLTRRDADLRFAHLRVSRAIGTTSEMLTAARVYLNDDAARAQRVLDFAREIYREGDRPAALALLEEIIRSSPNFAVARKQLTEWRPPSPPAGK